MKATARHRTARPEDLLRNWRASIFALVPETPTRRRASDVVRLATSLGLLAVVVLGVRDGIPFDDRVSAWISDVPEDLRETLSILRWVGSLGVVVAVVALALITRHFRIARDAGLAAALAAIIGLLVRTAAGSGNSVLDVDIDGISRQFPVIELAVAVAVVATVGPYLARPARRLADSLVIVALVATSLAGAGLPLDIVGAVLVGWAVAAAIHLVFGTPQGMATRQQVTDAAADLGIILERVEPDTTQEWGVARYRACDGAGGEIDVSVYGRDASDAQLLARIWRFVLYRDGGPTLIVTRALQVEHEGFLLLSAARDGVPAPTLLAAGVGGGAEDALVLTRGTDGNALADETGEVSDASLAAIWAAVKTMRDASIAHGAIDGTTIVLGPADAITLRDFRHAMAAAPADRLDRDVASTMIATALAVGVDRAVDAAVDGLGADAVDAALPMLQPAGVTSFTRHALRGDQKHLADELRRRTAEATGTDPPELAKLRRITAVDAVIVIGTVVGVSALVNELSSFNDIWATFKTADWWWVAVAFVLSQITNVAQAVAVTGTVSTPLALGPVIGLQFANAFTGLAGGTVATTATTIRFFQLRGLAPSVAISSGVLVSIASFAVQFVLFFVALPFAAGEFSFGQLGGSTSGLVQIVVVVLVAATVASGVALFIPRLRKQVLAKLKPQLDDARDNLRSLAGEPRNLIRLFGGNAVAQLLFALTLGASLHAYGASASLATLIVVNTLASILGGVAPVPGGMGVMEAGLIGGLTAAGIPDNQAVAATLTARMFTTYLPPTWGWFTLVWLRRHHYL